MTLSVIGIILSVIFLIIMAYKNISPLFTVPIATLIVALFSGQQIYEALTTQFLGGWSGMIVGIGWTFLGSMVFGEVMNRAGASEAIAYWFVDHLDVKKTAWIIYLTSAVLSYSGMSFGGYAVIYPIALILCQKANYNKGIIMGCVLGGAWTFSMTGPWSPTVSNTVTQGLFGTNSSAGLIPGLAGSLVMFFVGGLYLDWQVRKWQKDGRVFDSFDEVAQYTAKREELPNVFVALIPVIVSIVLYNVFNCNLGISLMIASFIAVLSMFGRHKPSEWLRILSDGAKSSSLPILNLSIYGGLSAALRATPVFAALCAWATTTNLSPYFVVALISTIFAAAMSSSSTAVNMIVASMPEVLTGYVDKGFNAGYLHRMIAMGSGGPSVLPFGGSMQTMNVMFKTNTKQSYGPVFWSCVVIPVLATYLVTLPLCMILK